MFDYEKRTLEKLRISITQRLSRDLLDIMALHHYEQDRLVK